MAKENIFVVDYAPSDTGNIASETPRNDVFCSMEYGETVSRDQNRNDEPADDIEEKKSSLKNSKEKTHVKAISGKRKDQKSTSFLWTRYLAVRNFNNILWFLNRTKLEPVSLITISRKRIHMQPQ